MTFGAIAFAGMSGVIRHLAADMHPFVVAFHRSLFALFWMLPWLIRYGGTVLRTRRPLFYAFRAGFQLVSMMAGFYAVAYMPIADATAISFTAPLFATAGAALILGETVRVRRWAATLVGFAGVLVVMQPGPETFRPVALFALFGAAATAGSFLTVKELSRTEPPTVIVVFMVLYLAPMSLVPALFVWSWPTWSMLPWLVAMGALGTLGHLAVTRGFAAAEMSVVLPFDYLRLPLSAAMAYFAFVEVPDRLTFLGTAIIAVASVYIAHRESVLAKQKMTQQEKT
ncbi:MAG: DMT family transporter [Proteobacteria bacterium]|nr:DMT family transporter [Pseudomonadota bacterium]